jgi:hypothetical protein
VKAGSAWPRYSASHIPHTVPEAGSPTKRHQAWLSIKLDHRDGPKPGEPVKSAYGVGYADLRLLTEPPGPGMAAIGNMDASSQDGSGQPPPVRGAELAGSMAMTTWSVRDEGERNLPHAQEPSFI